MVHIRLVSIVLGFLFVMRGISDCSSALAQDEAIKRNGLATVDHQEHDVSAPKELLGEHQGVIGVSMRKLWLQGRKMGAHMLWKEHEKESNGLDKLGTLKISGASHSDGKFEFEGRGDIFDAKRQGSAEGSKKSLERFDHHQDDEQPAVSLSNPTQMQPHYQDSKIISETEVSHEPYEDTQRLLLAAKEIDNLMQKDYKGMSKPRRKPPINNHEPRH